MHQMTKGMFWLFISIVVTIVLVRIKIIIQKGKESVKKFDVNIDVLITRKKTFIK